MGEVCNDNRFELIDAVKKELLENTNIETRPEELKVLDSILFRLWQIGMLEPRAKWKNYKADPPELDKEIIGFNPNWINEEFNPNGTRLGFLSENGFISAHWWNMQDTYITISKSEIESEGKIFSKKLKDNIDPTYWIEIPSFK